jgi:phospholipase A-2-activating protein
MVNGPYKLSASLVGHEDDVKAVVFHSRSAVASVSRDATLRLWNGENGHWKQNIIYNDSKYLNSLAWGDDLVACGGQNNTTMVLKPEEASTMAPLPFTGHTANVCSLDINFGVLISGSWDKDARVYDVTTGELQYCLQGHTQSVWAVCVLSPTAVLTGSADKSIRLWEHGKTTKLFENVHSDAIRALCQVSSSSFASCSNDGTIKLWCFDNTKQPVKVLTGHTSFVYSIAVLPGSRLVSGGEDRSARVWDLKTGQCLQVITLPCISVWSVSTVPNDDQFDDIVVGGSDNIIRVFSKDVSRWASEEEIKHLNETVANTGLGRDQVSVDESQVSPSSVLKLPGKKEGQVVMVRNELTGALEAHQWTTGIWMKVGEVIEGAAGSGRDKKTQFKGGEYDYVFDVDITDGQPPLKLPYNVSENPYQVAQKFVEQHELPAAYVDDVAKFIIKNSSSVDLSSKPASDPYGTRYLPGTGSKTDFRILPFSDYVSLVSFQGETIVKAIRSINARHAALGDDDISSIENCLNGLTTSSAETLFRYVVKLTESWTGADVLPALDILRIIIPSLPRPPAAIVQIVFANLDPHSTKHALLATRALTNLLATDSGRKLANNAQIRDAALDCLKTLVESNKDSSKPLDIAIASLVLNCAVLERTDVGACLSLISHISVFKQRANDSESVYRLLLSIGTLAVNSPPVVREAAVQVELNKWAAELPARFGEVRMKDLAKEVIAAISPP